MPGGRTVYYDYSQYDTQLRGVSLDRLHRVAYVTGFRSGNYQYAVGVRTPSRPATSPT